MKGDTETLKCDVIASIEDTLEDSLGDDEYKTHLEEGDEGEWIVTVTFEPKALEDLEDAGEYDD